MNCENVIKVLEDWAPKQIAWEKDNVGLQVGSLRKTVKNILLTLDVNKSVIREAIKNKCQLIISHHPLLFKPLKKIQPDIDSISSVVEMLIKNDITLYSAHTNLDFTKHGVSFQLAERLRLNNQKFLQSFSSNQNKLIVFVPASHLEKVAAALHSAGAGIIGEYSHCSFRTTGQGTFLGSKKSNPKFGKRENLEFVDEVKLEVIVNSFDLKKVIEDMKKAHPYEEVAYDVYPLSNENSDFGAGVIGELSNPMPVKDFLSYVSRSLKTNNFRYTVGSKKLIKKVAVCGGSCSDLLETAVRSNADAFVTADVKYHTFQDAENKILLIDAGHYETEIPVLDELKKRIETSFNNNIKVYKYKGSTNPVVFYNNLGA